MSNEIEYLQLSEAYDLRLTIRDGEHHFLADLHLTPEQITLKIFGELDEGRECSFMSLENLPPIITCQSINETFLVSGLRPISSSWRVLQRYPTVRSYFEVELTAEYVAHFNHYISASTDDILGIALNAPDIERWVGHTTTQDNIASTYQHGEFPKQTTEFSQRIKGIGHLKLNYSASSHFSPTKFTVGLRFPPKLLLLFNEDSNLDSSIKSFCELRSITSFIFGGDIAYEIVELISGRYITHRGSLYFPQNKHTKERSSSSLILFPLSKNLRFGFGLPEFPLSAWDTFFSLNNHEKGYFDKYLRYKRLNVEEQFLGMFRLLEALCLKKASYVDAEKLKRLIKRATPFLSHHFGDKKAVTAFLQRLPSTNGLKYNTEKCLRIFLEGLPLELRQTWKFGSADINQICKLRNDVVHANAYDASIEQMTAYAKFIETLLVIALANLLKIDLATTANIIDRLDQYSWIKKPAELQEVMFPTNAPAEEE